MAAACKILIKLEILVQIPFYLCTIPYLELLSHIQEVLMWSKGQPASPLLMFPHTQKESPLANVPALAIRILTASQVEGFF